MDIPIIFITAKSLSENISDIEKELDKQEFTLSNSSRNDELVLFLKKLKNLYKKGSITLDNFSFFMVDDIEFSKEYNNFRERLDNWDLNYTLHYR